MVLFPMSGVLRGFSACDARIEKIAHFQIGNEFVLSCEMILFSDKSQLKREGMMNRGKILNDY
jgi:hypothetical protein